MSNAIEEQDEKRPVLIASGASEHAVMLHDLVTKSLQEADYILTLPREPEELAALGLDAKTVLRVKAEILQHANTLSVKVDDARFRHQEHADTLDLLREQWKNIPIPQKDG